MEVFPLTGSPIEKDVLSHFFHRSPAGNSIGGVTEFHHPLRRVAGLTPYLRIDFPYQVRNPGQFSVVRLIHPIQ